MTGQDENTVHTSEAVIDNGRFGTRTLRFETGRQEFALRMARGDFHRADPQRGRFRQFLKVALINLVREYRKRRQRAGVPLDELKWQPAAHDAADSQEDQRWLASWREHLLERTWEALREEESRTGRPYHTILRFRSEHEQASSADIAAHLNAVLSPKEPWTEVAVRKLLQRARGEFADLLVREVKDSMGCHTPEELEAEAAKHRELEALIARYHPDAFWFADDVFTISHKWLFEFDGELKRRDLKIRYECITRADRMNEQVVEALRSSGCTRLWIGSESGSQRRSVMLQGLANSSSLTEIRLRPATSNNCGLASGTRSPGLR